MKTTFRVVIYDCETCDCTPVSQSYSNKRDALLQYHFTKEYIKEGLDLLVTEYTFDAEGHEFYVRDLSKDEMELI